jgi:hypothetical protein
MTSQLHRKSRHIEGVHILSAHKADDSKNREEGGRKRVTEELNHNGNHTVFLFVFMLSMSPR